MKVNTTGRKVNLKPNFLNLVEEKLEKLDKFFPEEVQAYVTVTVEKDWQTVEVTIKDHGISFRSEKSAPKMELALEAAVDKIESQIIKNRKKLTKKLKEKDALGKLETELPAGNTPRASYKYDLLSGAVEEEEEYEIVRKKIFDLEPQSVEDAIFEMNMLDHTFFMFKDVVTEEINVVYKRKDGKYGLLLPQ